MDPKTIAPTTDAEPEWHDPFCEPQTIPAGWNVSALELASIPPSMDESAYPED
jgi:hypothetical protein